jgi:hypothetical protein
MLHGAAPAETEVRALGVDSRRRSLEHVDENSFIVLPMSSRTLEYDALTRQGTRYERGLRAA